MDFTWSESIHAAFASCLPCLVSHDSPPSPGPDRIPRARPDELEGLLADADALSLHSNIGFPGRRKRSKKKGRGLKRISIFGYDLFGRPPIQLPADDEEHDQLAGEGRRTRTTSSSTLDSDAAPLDASAIQNLSSPPPPPPPELSPEEQEKEARRQRRRARKELERANAALSSQTTDEFEGFPGSGSGPPIHSPLEGSQHTHSSTPSSNTIAVETTDEFEGFPGSGSQIPRRPQHTGSSQSDEFGEFAQADFGGIKPVRDRTNALHGRNGKAERKVDEDEDEDLGGELYSRHRAGGSSHGSDSRSRTSGSQSQQSQGRYVQQQPHKVPLPQSPTSTSFSTSSVGVAGKRKQSPLVPIIPAPLPFDGAPVPERIRPPPRKAKSKSKSSSGSSKSASAKAPSSSSTSQSPSLQSPLQSQFSSHHHRPQVALVQEPEEFEGFPLDDGSGGGGFPSTGFGFSGGGRERLGGKGRDMGAFLASRGNS